MNDKPKLFTAQEVALYLNCNVQTVYRYANKGIIKSVKCGSLRRFEMPEQIAEKLQEDK